MSKTEIVKLNIDWLDVKNECRNTVNKEPSEIPATEEFKKKLLISEHSPIRLLTVKWRWKELPSWIATHFARHWLGWDKWISTQRTDRTGKDRNAARQDAPVNMDISANAQALINVSRYRLCYQASPETRKQMEDLKRTIKNSEASELADVMQKNCIYRAGCPEFSSCGYWESFCKKHRGENLLDIRTRYELADEDFY